jgi:hypothetical protein
LLSALPAEDLKNLLLLLTFATPSGACVPSVQQLAHAMNISERKVRRRMDRLAQFRFQDKPLIIALKRGNGSDAYALAAGSIAGVSNPGEHHPNPDPAMPTPSLTRKERVIETSRRQWTRPRAAVEREIAQDMGWDQPPHAPSRPAQPTAATTTTPANSTSTPQVNQVRERLQEVGVEAEWVDYLIANHDLERIERQLHWLPYRKAQNPARLIVSAIEKDYEQPYALRGGQEAA